MRRVRRATHVTAAVDQRGRRDMSCPADTAHALAQAWPDAELTLVDDSGHKGSPAFAEAIGTAVRRFSP